MADDQATWLRHSYLLALTTASFHFLQFVSGTVLWQSTASPALLAFGLDALVSAAGAVLLASRVHRVEAHGRHRVIGYGYIAASLIALYSGGMELWSGQRPASSILGIALAAVSMLVIPIIGSYMKVLAVELRSQPLRAAAIFTFGNSYLAMVLLIALLLNAGMNYRWGDALGALVMFPFMSQKGIQILLDEGKQEYVDD
jgi:divalent metal cation (Fe/Co/Zn/Cd) transporter